MKRVIAACMATFMLTSGMSVTAETIDFTNYSDTEFMNLNEQIGLELANRGVLKKAELVAGYYVAGKDIPTGRYLLRYLEEKDSKFVNYYIFQTETEYQEVNWWDSEKNYIADSVWKYDDAGAMVYLEEGNVIYISEGKVEIEMSSIVWK